MISLLINAPILICFFLLFVSFLQKVSEKVGGAEGTKLDDDFTEMEKASLCSPHDLH